MYNPSIFTKRCLTDAFTAGTKMGHDEMFGEKDYGFGWFVCIKGGNMVAQHDGSFAGFRSYVERHLEKHNTIDYPLLT